MGLLALCVLASCATAAPQGGQGTGGAEPAGTPTPDSRSQSRLARPGLGCGGKDLPERRAVAVAVDGQGKVRWQVGLAVTGHDDSGVGALVDGDTVYTTQGRELRALAGADGRELWRLPLDGMVYDATVHDGVLVAIVGPVPHGKVLGVDAATGAVRWRFAFEVGKAGESLSGWNVIETSDGGVVVITNGRLVVIERQSGAVRWERRGRDRGSHGTGAAGGLVLLVNGRKLEAYQAATGQPVWAARHTIGRPVPLPVDNGVVLAVEPYSDAVEAFDLASGKRLWRYRPQKGQAWVVGAGPAGVAVGGHIAGRDYLALLDTRTGEQRWRQRAWPRGGGEEQRFVTRSLVDAERVVVIEKVRMIPAGSKPGKVVARAASDGRVLWQLDLDGTITRFPAGRLLLKLDAVEPASPGNPAEGAVEPPPPGDVVALDTAGATGTVAWRLRLPAFAGHDPVPLRDGAVFQVHDPVRICVTPGAPPG